MKKHAEHEEAMKNPPESAGTEEIIATGKAHDAPEAASAADAATGATRVTETAAEPGSAVKTAADKTASAQADAAKEKASDKKTDKAAEQTAALNARIAELEKLNAELQDQYLRKAADFDNYRKRMIKEKQDAIDFANTNLLVDLVQVLDDFDRAISAGGAHEAGTPAAAFADGVSMIRKQLGGMLESKYGLAYYPVKGAHFDPTLHEAIGSLPSPDVKEPTVSEEFTKGYKLKDRIIRVAKVMVQMPAETASQ